MNKKFVVADIGTSQKAPPTLSNRHCSRCRLDCQHPRDRHHCLFQGIPHLHNLQISSYIISKRREAMTTQKSFGRPREDGSTQHTLTISHASYMANSTSPEFLSLCPISLSDLQCKLCQHIVDQHCTINISCAHSSTEG